MYNTKNYKVAVLLLFQYNLPEFQAVPAFPDRSERNDLVTGRANFNLAKVHFSE